MWFTFFPFFLLNSNSYIKSLLTKKCALTDWDSCCWGSWSSCCSADSCRSQDRPSAGRVRCEELLPWCCRIRARNRPSWALSSGNRLAAVESGGLHKQKTFIRTTTKQKHVDLKLSKTMPRTSYIYHTEQYNRLTQYKMRQKHLMIKMV